MRSLSFASHSLFFHISLSMWSFFKLTLHRNSETDVVSFNDLFSVSPDGTSSLHFYKISDDGKTLVHSTENNKSLMLVDLTKGPESEATELFKLGSEEIGSFSISSDGTRIVFVKN